MDVAQLRSQNLLSLLEAYNYGADVERVLSIVSRNPPSDPTSALSSALRHHREQRVSSPIEIWFRDSVDSLLTFCSILEIASQASFVDLSVPATQTLVAELSVFLGHPDVKNYYTANYPLYLPRLLLARLEGSAASVEVPPDANALFLKLLTLDTRFRKNHGNGVLLALLDDYRVQNTRFEDVAEVFEDPARLIPNLISDADAESQPVVRAAVREFPNLLAFCVDLADLLSRMDSTPEFQSAFWHYYGYWFGRLSARLRRRLSDGVRAVQSSLLSVSSTDADLDPVSVRAEVEIAVQRSVLAVSQLTSPKYAAPIVGVVSLAAAQSELERIASRSPQRWADRADNRESSGPIGVTILGSTGSIGESTLDVLARHPDKFKIIALGAHRNVEKLAAQVLRWRPAYAALSDHDAGHELIERLGHQAAGTRIVIGPMALSEIATLRETDCVMAAVPGAAGLPSTLAAAHAGKRLLLANNEALVMAGPLLLAAVRASGATLLPIDSAHSAIFQCLPPETRIGKPPPGVRKILLTASGGPFRDTPRELLESVTPEDACAHPNWVLGRRASVDSATLMNKGLQLIEACALFGMPPERIEIVVHPQSVVHSMVEYLDGSVLAQLGSPDVRTPIAHALAWPERIASGVESLDLVRVGRLDFHSPDYEKFQCLRLAQEAARIGELKPTLLNAANEIAVQAFLDRRVRFTGIAAIIDQVMTEMKTDQMTGLDQVMDADAEAKVRARQIVQHTAGSRAPNRASFTKIQG